MTTPEQHIKYLAYSHLGYGGLMALLGLLMIGFFNGVLGLAPEAPPVGIMILFSLFIAFIYGLMTVPSLIAGYGLLKNKKWAKTASIIGGVTAASNFPIGTAVCVYTFWFLFSEPGKSVFEKQNFQLPPGRQWWAKENSHQRQEQPRYVPPSTPPDWR